MQFTDLPNELQVEVLLKLDGVSLARCERVCRQWYILLTRNAYNYVWRRKCFDEIDNSALVEITGDEDIQSFDATRVTDRSEDCFKFWKCVYKRWIMLRNVCKNVFRSRVEAHCDRICDIKIYGSIIYTASINGVIKLWDSKTETLVKKFTVNHSGHVNAIALFPVEKLYQNISPRLLFAASADSTVSVWELETDSRKELLFGHSGIVSCIVPYKNMLVTASHDGTIKLWEIEEESETKCIGTLRQDNFPIFDLSVSHMKALCVHFDKVALWSLETKECLQNVPINSVGLCETIDHKCVLREKQAIVFNYLGIMIKIDCSNTDQPSQRQQLLDFCVSRCSRFPCFTILGGLMVVASEVGDLFLYRYQSNWTKVPDIDKQLKSSYYGASCVALSCDDNGPIIVTALHDGVIDIFR